MMGLNVFFLYFFQETNEITHLVQQIEATHIKILSQSEKITKKGNIFQQKGENFERNK